MSRRHRWTAKYCYAQLRVNGIELAIGEEDKLVVIAPDGMDLRHMLPVIRLYKPGLLRILRGEDGACEADNSSIFERAGTPTPPSLALCRKIELIKKIFAEFQPTVVSVVRKPKEDGRNTSVKKIVKRPDKLTPFGLTEIVCASTTPPKGWHLKWAKGNARGIYVTTRTPAPAGDIISTSCLQPGQTKLGRPYEYWRRQVDDG